MPHKKEPVKQRRIGESGYVLPDHITPGEVVTGVTKERWRIGKSIGELYYIELHLDGLKASTFRVFINLPFPNNAFTK